MTTDAMIGPLLILVGVLVTAGTAGCVSIVVALLRYLTKQRLLELWNRDLVDQIYRGEAPPPRPAPAGLFD